MAYKIVTPNYPEVPVLQVEVISTIDETKREIIGAILDPGSSITVIPSSLIRKISPQVTGETRIVDVLGRETPLRVYAVRIVLIDYPNLPHLSVQVVEGGFKVRGIEYAIIGQNILNRFKLILDGPNRKIEIVT